MDRGSFSEVRYGSGVPRRGPERVGGPSLRFGTGRGTLGKVRDRSWDPWVGAGWVGRHLGGLGRVEGPSGIFGTGRGTLGEVRDGSGTCGEVLNGSGDHP